MLTGTDLLNQVKAMGEASKSEIVKACGYISQKKDGGERLNFTAFYEALLEAKGVGLGIGGGTGKGGRKLSYKAVVQGNGNLLVGKAYTAMLDLQASASTASLYSFEVLGLLAVGSSPLTRC